jgi:hypothetical protein
LLLSQHCFPTDEPGDCEGHWRVMLEAYRHLGLSLEQRVGWDGLNRLLAELPWPRKKPPLRVLCDLLEILPVDTKILAEWGWKDPVLALDSKESPFASMPVEEATTRRWNREMEKMRFFTTYPDLRVSAVAVSRKERFEAWGLLGL